MKRLRTRGPEEPWIDDLAERLARLLSSRRFDYLVVANNFSHHVLHHLLRRRPTDLSSVLPRLLALNAVNYLRGQNHALILFVSELEYGRTLRQAWEAVPLGLRTHLQPIVLIENGADYAREGRPDWAHHTPTGPQRDLSSPHTESAIPPPPLVCHSLESEAFHLAIGKLRDLLSHTLVRPFNVDATLFYLNFHGTEFSTIVPTLAKLGLLTEVNAIRPTRWTLIEPRCLNEFYIQKSLGIPIASATSFAKVRFYSTPDPYVILAAPMYYTSLRCSAENLGALNTRTDSSLLAQMLSEARSHLRGDVPVQSRSLLIYDIIGFWGDVLLLGSLLRAIRTQGVRVTATLDDVILDEYYGHLLAPALKSQIDLLLEKETDAATSTDRAPLVNEPPLFSPTTAGLIKTAALRHYESSNDPVLPRWRWQRAGLSFGELLDRTGLASNQLSLGLDFLSDHGLTESYNRCQVDPTGSLLLERAFNSLSDEFMTTVAVVVGRLNRPRQANEWGALTTAPTVLGKFLVLLHYFQGFPKTSVWYHEQGKTIIFHTDPAKGLKDDLTSLVKMSAPYLEIDPKTRAIRLTEEGRKRDWLLHLPKAGLVFGFAQWAETLWETVRSLLRTARSEKKVPSDRSVFEAFSALVDCAGDEAPEWGLATPAQLIEWALWHSNKGRRPKADSHLRAAHHKLGVLAEVAPLLGTLYEDLYGRRSIDPFAASLLKRLAVLPPDSRLVRLLSKILTATRGAIEQPRVDREAAMIRRWCALVSSSGDTPAVSDGDRLAPEHEKVEGYVVFLDLFPSKKLAEFRLPWLLRAATRLAVRWAGLQGASSIRPLSDALVACFENPLAALRCAAGTSVHVAEAYHVFGHCAGLEVGLVAGIEHGEVEMFETGAGNEVTGLALARAASTKSIRDIAISEEVWRQCLTFAEGGRLKDHLRSEDGRLMLDARTVFDLLILGPEGV